jgi:hypothetical protein
MISFCSSHSSDFVDIRERSALDKINTIDSPESAAIEGECLDENMWKVLRKAAEQVTSAILSSALGDAERKKSISRTLLGSLYFMSVDGSSEGWVKSIPTAELLMTFAA